ncbi:MAG TPA: DUF4435 domain-containing protein [Fimbriimonas sp.]|nr:DUF4435 domain-containing protein [Fimbriimonas sp.]
MSTLVSTLKSSRKSAIVTYYDFIKRATASPDAIFCFFEGEDNKYYVPIIEHVHVGIRIEFFNCGGKSKVFELDSKLSSKIYSVYRKAFFVDGDFDSTLTPSSIYVTPCYSIENLYVNRDCFRKILKSEFLCFDDGSTECDHYKVMAHFDESLKQFCKNVFSLNAWILAQRRSSTSISLKRASLDNIRIHKFVKVNLDGIVKLQKLSECLNLGNLDASLVTRKQLLDASKVLRAGNPICDFRGKFQMYFFISYLKLLISDANSTAPTKFTLRTKVKLSLSEGNAISELSSYAKTPLCLRTYIQAV